MISPETPDGGSPSCPLCSSTEIAVHLEVPVAAGGPARISRVLKCRPCSFRFTHPRPSAEEIARLYPETYGPYQRGELSGSEVFNRGASTRDRIKNRLKWCVLRQRYGYADLPPPQASAAVNRLGDLLHRPLGGLFYRAMRYYYPRIPQGRFGGKALDVGCGNGAHLLLLKRLGWEVAGFDLADHTVPEVRAAGIPVHTGALEELVSRAGGFDLITMWHVLEHVANPRQTLRSLRRLLAPEGVLMLEVPCSDSLAAKLFGRHWVGYDLPRHLSHFSVKTARRLLDEEGFAVVRQGWSWKQHLPASLSRARQARTRPRSDGRWLERPVSRFCLRAVGHLLALAGAGEAIHLTAIKRGVE